MDADEVPEDWAPFMECHTLEYSNSSKSLLVDFDTRFVRLADSDTLADCEFVVGPEQKVIKGHKVLFCFASEVFYAMFLGHLKETKPVHVEDLEPDGFQGMKKYIYTGLTDFKSVFEALSTYIAARKYLIVPLTRECVKYVGEKLKPSQVLEFLDSCKTNSISVFDDLCSKLVNENTAEIVESDYFSSANMETIELILKSPSLKLKSEVEVFGLFERWALAETERQGIPAEDIATSFGSLKKHIRFLTISGEDFVSRIEPSPLLTRDEKYVIAMNKIKFNPNLTSENISMLKIPRRLNMSHSDNGYQQKHMFHIPTNSRPYGNRNATSINLLPRDNANFDRNSGNYNYISIYWTNFSQSICIEAELNFYGSISSRRMIVIKSKLRVLSSHECDNLFFTKQCELLINRTNSYDSSPSNSLVLAVIPKNSLKTEHYSKNNRNLISIEGLFTVERINL